MSDIPSENHLRLIGKGDYELYCPLYLAWFNVIWEKNNIVEGINYCPFCGDEFENKEEEDGS